MIFISSSKTFSFCPGQFGHVGKWLDKKAKANLKTYDNTNWETNNHNTHIASMK